MIYHFSELFSLFGGFLGIILSVVVLSIMRGRRAVKIASAAALMVSSMIVILGSMLYSGKIVHFPFLLRIDSPIHYLLGPSLFFYTLTVIKPDFKFRLIHLIHITPFLINLFEFLPFYFSPQDEKLTAYQAFLDSGSVILPLHYLFKTISVSAYFIAQLFLFVKSRNSLKNQKILFSWLLIYLSGQLIMITGAVADHLSGLNITLDPYRFAVNMVTLFLYSAALSLLFFPRLLYGIFDEPPLKTIKYQRSGLADTEKEDFLKRWNDYLNGPDKPYLNLRMNLNDVAGILKIRPQQLSQVINEKTGLNFNECVNLKRVEVIKTLLVSEEQKNLTIEAIAKESGFNSKASFYAAFKKHTGMTPKEYMLHKKAAKKG